MTNKEIHPLASTRACANEDARNSVCRNTRMQGRGGSAFLTLVLANAGSKVMKE